MRRMAVAACTAVAIAACQGNFEAPEFNNLRDPANGRIPATPLVNAEAQPCAIRPPTIRISWTVDDATGITGFQIYRAASAVEDRGFLIATVGASENEMTDGNLPGQPELADATEYWYRVRAIANGGVVGLRSAPDSAVAADCPGGV